MTSATSSGSSVVSNGHYRLGASLPMLPFLAKLKSMDENEFRMYAMQKFREVVAFEADLEKSAGSNGLGVFSVIAARAARGKNRYSDIAPYDANRVHLHSSLKSLPAGADDYINASLVKVLFGLRTFIAAQGPLSNTAGDFWEMIWEQNTRVIVMVTKEEENGREKVFRYWPSSGQQTFRTLIGELTVKLVSAETTGDTVTRTFTVSLGDQAEREVVQVQYVGWPDHGIPDKQGEMLAVLETANRHQRDFALKRSVGPMLVHCSAGCGRTGTIIALDTFLRLLELDTATKAGKLDSVDMLTETKALPTEPLDWSKDWIFELVKQLRTQRTTMVQAFDQYRFLYLEIAARLGSN